MQTREKGTFNIVRFYRKDGKKSRIMQRGLTWKMVQNWLNDKDSRKEGVYFDGFNQTN